MNSDRATPLPDLPFFRQLTPEAKRLLASARRRRFRRGQALWLAGSEAAGLAVILSGHVRVVRAVDGRQYAVHSEGPGATLGEVPFFAGGRYPATAIATEPTSCLWLDRQMVALAVDADPALAMRWLERLATRVRQLVERLDQQTARTVEQRLATLLLERHLAAGGGAFSLGATQAEAAEELGTVREVLVRALRRFREAGLVERCARGSYRVRRLRALTRVATL